MRTTVSSYNFVDAFRSSQYKDNFSYSWLHALFDYLEDYEAQAQTEIELDIVALACDYSEYPSAIEACKEHGLIGELTEWEEYTPEEMEENALELLKQYTTVIQVEPLADDTPSIIIQSF